MKHETIHPSSQNGQIVLITLLVVSVAITIILSLIGRATSDVAMSNQVAQSSRAFNAAEIGIEEALKAGQGSNATISSGATYNVTQSNIGGAVGLYEFPNKIDLGQVATLWLANQDGTNPYPTSANIDVCWNSIKSSSLTPAISVNILYKTQTGSYQVAREAYDPESNRSTLNNFILVSDRTGCGDGATTYKRKIIFSNLGITSGDQLIAARFQPHYSDIKLAVNASSALPLQGKRFESTGSLPDGVTRKIVVFQQFKSAPAIFDNVIYSQGNFAH